jgi:hypothetical protein
VTLVPQFTTGTPRLLAEMATSEFGTGSPLPAYDVASDGRLLTTTRENRTPPPPAVFNVIVNWFDELRAKVPGK